LLFLPNVKHEGQRALRTEDTPGPKTGMRPLA